MCPSSTRVLVAVSVGSCSSSMFRFIPAPTSTLIDVAAVPAGFVPGGLKDELGEHPAALFAPSDEVIWPLQVAVYAEFTQHLAHA